MGGNTPWMGDLDEVEVYNRVLTGDEIAGIFNAGQWGKCKPSCLTVTCVSNKTVECGSSWTFDLPSVSSCCGSNVTITPSTPVTNSLCPQVITETWLITDACSDSASCSQTVTVEDTNPPVILCPTNIVVVACTNVQEFYTVTATDPCTGSNLPVVCNPASGSYFAPDTTNVVCCAATNPCNGLTNSCCFIVAVVCNCVQQPANMVLWLPFDESAGTSTPNLAAPAYPGTEVGNPTQISGYVDNSLSFNGSSQYVTVPDYPGIDIGTNNFTIDAWVNRPTNGPNSLPSVILDKRNTTTGAGYTLSVSYGRLVMTLAISGSSINYESTGGVAVPPDGLWHFVAVSVSQSASNVLFYIDGALISTLALTPMNVANTNSMWVGAGLLGGNRPWTGDLDEVEVYNRALASNEIAGIYNAGPAGKCKPPCFTVTCATNKTVQCGSSWTFDLPSVSSCCGTNVTITPATPVTNGFCPQVITETWLITDACSNSTTCSQTVTVEDTTPPVIVCPTNAYVVFFNTNCNFAIPQITPPASDICAPASQLVYTQTPQAGTVTNVSPQNVIVTVTDLCGNSSQCVVEVIGRYPPPVITCPATITVSNCLVPCITPYVTVTDCSCPPSSLTISQSPLCDTPIGTGVNSVTVTVTDCHGNSAKKVVSLIVYGSDSFLAALFNTGVGDNHTLLADDTVDSHYALPVTAVPAPMPGDYYSNAVAVSDICHATGTDCAWLNGYVNYLCYVWTPWGLTSPYSKWIAPDYTNNGCCPVGLYTYDLQFTLPAGIDTAAATISGRWAADNTAAMALNGLMVANPAPNWNQWTSFTIPPGSGFQGGLNTLSFIVSNASAYTGLRVEFTNASACFTNPNLECCCPPEITSITPTQTLPVGSTATFNVKSDWAGSYQWYYNGAPLANGGSYSGVTTSTMRACSIGGFGFPGPGGGLYSVVISNACGVVTGYVQLNVTWPEPVCCPVGYWNVAVMADPLSATIGPDLNLVGSSFAAKYAITAGTTTDFGLPEEAGQIVNVMDINPLAGASIQMPLIAGPGSNSVNSYTVLMDIYEPDTSLGTPSTLFQSLACCLGTGGQDGVALTVDSTNNLHLTGSAAGVSFDTGPAALLPVDAWERVGLVVDDPQNGVAVNLALYLNGQQVASLNVPTPVGLPINWSNSPPTLLSAPTNATSPNGEFCVSSIQFNTIALTPALIAGVGSPDDGLASVNQTSAGAAPTLSVTVSSGVVNITWSATPYALQEATDLSSGVWVTSALPFTETEVNGNIVTTAVATPAPGASAKFYRLVFRP
jgi:hypothetical protein